MLLGMPPSWLGSNVVVPTYVLSFFLVHNTILYDILNDLVPPAVLDSVLIVADSSLRALSIAKLGVDGSRMRFAADSHVGAGDVSEPWFAMLFLGMVAGSGGGMWADLLKLKSHHWTFSTPSFVHAATYDMKAAFLSAFFYAASTSPQFYQLLRGDPDLDASSGKVGLLELQDAKAMTMLVMCTLMLGQRAEQTFLRLTGLDSGSSTWGKSSALKQSKGASKKNDDTNARELKAMSKIDQDDEKVYQPLRRRGRHAEEPTEDEEEQEEEEEEEDEEPVKKSTRGRKKGSGKKLGSPTPSSSVSADVPLTRSTRLRKPARQEL